PSQGNGGDAERRRDQSSEQSMDLRRAEFEAPEEPGADRQSQGARQIETDLIAHLRGADAGHRDDQRWEKEEKIEKGQDGALQFTRADERECEDDYHRILSVFPEYSGAGHSPQYFRAGDISADAGDPRQIGREGAPPDAQEQDQKRMRRRY